MKKHSNRKNKKLPAHPALHAVLSRTVGKDLLLQIAQRSGGQPVPLVRIIQMIRGARASSTSLSRDIHGQRHRHDQTRNRARQRKGVPEGLGLNAANSQQNQTHISRKTFRKTTEIPIRHLQKTMLNPMDSCRKPAKSSEHPQKNHLDSNQTLAEDHAESNGDTTRAYQKTEVSQSESNEDPIRAYQKREDCQNFISYCRCNIITCFIW